MSIPEAPHPKWMDKMPTVWRCILYIFALITMYEGYVYTTVSPDFSLLMLVTGMNSMTLALWLK